MKSLLAMATIFLLLGCSSGDAATLAEPDLAVSQAARDDCKDMGYETVRRNCEAEFMAQPRILRAYSRMKELLGSLQAKIRAADNVWNKGPINDGDPKYVDALNSAQKAWGVYAKQDCLLESFAVRGGTDQSHHQWGCNLKMKEARVVQLEKWEREF